MCSSPDPLSTFSRSTIEVTPEMVERADIPNLRVDLVNHPAHYTSRAIEVIDVIETFELPYHLGNVVKYLLRCTLKGAELQDLKKAQWYLNRYISKLESK